MRFRLAEHGRVFSTRSKGSDLLELLEREAEGVTGVVEVDFEGVQSISYSFADEFVGELMRRAETGAYSFEPSLVEVALNLRRVIESSLDNRAVRIDRENLFAPA